MPIRWSALKVSEAMDMAEEFVNKAAEPLEQAKIVATAARKIANLPDYLDNRLCGLLTQIGRIDNVKGAIESVRKSIPGQAIEDEKARLGNGTTQSLM